MPIVSGEDELFTFPTFSTEEAKQPIDPEKVKFFSKSIGSLVLVKPLLQKMRIAEIIDRICPADPQQQISRGHVIELLAANRLLAPQPLYSVQIWAEDAAVHEVYGIDSALLNDDRLGRTLDAIHEHLTTIKSEIALSVAHSFQIGLEQIH